MLKNVLQLMLVIIVIVSMLSFKWSSQPSYSKYSKTDSQNIADFSVEEILIALGEKPPMHFIPKADVDSARMGEEMVKFGAIKDGSNKKISKYFVCTDCHNQQKESADPSNVTPSAVLTYSKENKIPFVPASTFYGMYNKRHWYNGDYAKKYGDLVVPTRDTLQNAIQLCATQCSQGRKMTDWEIRCILHYYKTIELKMSDLVFTDYEIKLFSKTVLTDKPLALKIIHTRYHETNDATFGTSKIPEIEGHVANLENAEYIYKYGCLHCHSLDKKITNFNLGMDKLSFKFLEKKLYKYNSFSLSHITRYGTYSVSGRKQYMPQYTMEKMSDSQLLDLIEYIKVKAKE